MRASNKLDDLIPSKRELDHEVRNKEDQNSKLRENYEERYELD